MKIRHKRYGAVESKSWGNVIKIVDNEDNNYSGKIINVNQNNQTSTHFHSKKHKTFYVLSGTLLIDVRLRSYGGALTFQRIFCLNLLALWL